MPRKDFVVLFASPPSSQVEAPLTGVVVKPLNLRLRKPSRPGILLRDGRPLDILVNVRINPFKVVPDDAVDVADPENSRLVLASGDCFVEPDPLSLLWRIGLRYSR